MSYTVDYRIDLLDGDLSAALAIALRLARGSNIDTCSATLLTESADRAHTIASLRSGALSVTSPPDLDVGFTHHTVRLTGVDDAAIEALRGATTGNDGFSLHWSCSRFWHDAWIGSVIFCYNCSRVGGFWIPEQGKLEVRVAAILDHWPETDARAVFAELAIIPVGRVLRE